MKRSKLLNRVFNLVLAVCFMLVSVVFPGDALAYTVINEDNFEEPIAEGVTIQTITQYTSEGTLKIYVMKVDLTNPYVQVNTMVGTGNKLTGATAITKMTENAGAVAGINGDFFQMDEKAPIGLTVQDGEIISSPAQRNDMYGFGITTDKLPMINIFGFEGQVKAANGQTYPLFGVNKPTYLALNGVSSDKDTLNLYTPRWGEKSRGKLPELTETVEVVVENDIVREVRTNMPGVTIPQNGYVLSANGKAAAWVKENLKPGTGVSVSYRITPGGENLQAAVGGQAMLVNYGKRSWFTQNITGKRARTSIGYTQDRKTMYLVVVDGGNGSRGMTQEELADFMASLGCWQAINLDGGGSSTMAARLLGDDSISLINKPVYTSQRAVPTGIGIFSTAPAGEFKGLKITGDRYLLVGTTRSYSAKGYDEHYNPYKVEPSQITWRVEPDLGTFEGNVLTAHESGDAKVIASMNGVEQAYDIHILGATDIAKVEVFPNAIELNENDSVALSLVVTAKNGIRFNVKATEVQWEVQGEVGQVAGESFIAAGTKGTGQLTAVIDGVKAVVPVSIGAAEKPYSGLETFQAYRFAGYPAGVTGNFRAAVPGEPVFRGTGAGILEYDLTKAGTTAAAYGRFGDGLTLPGHPLGLGVWVYGNGGNNHWLRAKLVDANGEETLVDLAKNVNWQGWKHVTGKFPADIKYPVKLSSIYVVETDKSRLNKGFIALDELTLLMPVTAQDLSALSPEPQSTYIDIKPGTVSKGKLGDNVEISIPANALPAQQIQMSEKWSLDMATPGFNPVLPAFEIAGKSSSNTAAQRAKPYTLSVKYTGNADINRIRLMKWNPGSQKWTQVPQKVDKDRRIVTAKTEQLGLFALLQDVRPVPVFNDINNSWARGQIEQMAAKGLVSGFPGNRFLPQKGVTRAEFVVLLSNLFGWSANNENLQFKDSIPAWARGAVAAAVERGIVAGYADGRFQPDKMINRAEMAVIINKCLQLPDSKQPSAYADAGKIPTWAVQSIRNTKVAGLLKGSNNLFRPQDTATRAEATVVLANMLEYYMNTAE
ncbi:phosphodiester glycosidase family protein [Thermincola potens]|uniref:S-layer domain protein n=1 Tax=Thermincola potens (strain JR) TaxID=635013 RepID=D5XBK0_THEPJ|nr:phosphodiester glycosidase family protein [Thermincola potens]ADG83429.1 S-layer domain protein [Thermincola potens JR]